ncbi:hypothetical protein [Devosia faecipullorum]|uniref:hypothetical protein n=1 Tax=Devosia faecipullorum TaxID=2755039 RepID=UPI00187B92A2|nr:hypothetical protein [Devosia faecipullorum]MBE7733002.1 hypothetical protein [Devosia faecipullorum]
MLRQILLALAFFAFGHGSTLAQDAEEQAFVTYQTARAIDNKCHFLRYFEALEAGGIETDLLRPLWFSSAYDAGKIDAEQYLAAFNKLADMGKAVAAGINCADQQAAAPHILALRDQIAYRLYSDIMIAFEDKGLSDERKQAGHAYEAMIAPLYGEHWPAFLAQAQRFAQAKVDDARSEDAESALAFGLFDFGDMYEEELEAYGIGGDDFYVQSLISGMAGTLDSILFDMKAEAAGYRARMERSPADESAFFTTLADASGARVYDLLGTPARYELYEQTGEVYLVFAATQDRQMRILTWGEDAPVLLADGSVTLLINPKPLPPAQKSDYAYMRSQQWWGDAIPFRAQRLDEPCLGAPCFGLPPEAMEAILKGSPDQPFRFYISSALDTVHADPEDLRTHTGYTYALYRWQALKAAEAQ